MSGVPFVTGELQNLINREAEVGVDLNHAAESTVVTRECAPRLVADVLDADLFGFGQIQLRSSPAPAFVNRRVDHRGKTLRWNDKARSERRVSIDQPPAIADQFSDAGTNIL